MNTETSQTMSAEIGRLALALSKAQGEMKNATKDATNPFFKSKYADLASVWDVARGPLTKNELSILQTTEADISGVTIITILAHSSGEWIKGALKMTPVDKEGKAKNDPQSIGSAITYARRYALSAIVGVATEDDDAESATDRNHNQQHKKPQAVLPPPPYGKTKGNSGDDVLWANISPVLDAEFLTGLGFKAGKDNNGKYYVLYTPDLENTLRNRLEILREVA